MGSSAQVSSLGELPGKDAHFSIWALSIDCQSTSVISCSLPVKDPFVPSALARCLTDGRRLHALLNARACPPDIDAQYQAYFARRQALFDATSLLLETDGMGVSLHDAFIDGFSERRTAGGWRSTFHANAIAYGPAEAGGMEEKGYCRVVFDVATTQRLRPMAGREIHTFLVDPATRELGAIYHRPGRNMGQVVVGYTRLAVDKGPLRSWKDLREQRLATVPNVEAVLRVEHTPAVGANPEPVLERPARWYVDGTIRVLEGEQWFTVSELSIPLMEEAVDRGARVWVDAGVPAVKSQLATRLSEDHGPGHHDIRPLKRWLRQQHAQRQSAPRGPRP